MNTSLSTATRHESIVETAGTAAHLRAQIQLIQDVMRNVMIKDVHYGQIPGTPKPTLYKPGAEMLGLVFHIAPTFRTDDLSTTDSIRYRVHCTGRHQTTGVDLGEGLGECSSDEAKYRWRAPVCDEEFNEFPVDRRREKWNRGGGGGAYKQKQVRTESVDIANTVLKMAAKRAHIAMILNVLAASDIFSQDLEDLPEEMVSGMGGPQSGGARQAPAQRPRPAGGGGFINEKMVKLLRVKLNNAEMSAEVVCNQFGVDSITKLPFEKMNDALAFIASGQKVAGNSDAAEPSQQQ